MAISFQTEIEGREISLSNLDKIFWPEQAFTKSDLIKYYAEIAPLIIAHLQDRPLVFTRYPNGIEGDSFYQKNAPSNKPDWINTFKWNRPGKKRINFILVEEKAALIWLTNQACIEIHPWMSRINTINKPDYMIFDLDPSSDNSFTDVIELALSFKQLLEELKLQCWVKTSGASGLHIYVPFKNADSYMELRNLAGQVAGIVSQALPHKATIERTIAARGGRIYIDFMQIAQGQTICAPYSVRSVAGATVSTPLRWEELQDISPQDFNIKTTIKRAAKLGDLFAPVLSNQQDIKKVLKYLKPKSVH